MDVKGPSANQLLFLVCISLLTSTRQIAGGQGQVSHFVELLVWAPVAFVAEGGEHHVEAESNIQLHCQLRPEANQQHYNNTNNNETIATREQMAFHQLTLPMVQTLLLSVIIVPLSSEYDII